MHVTYQGRAQCSLVYMGLKVFAVFKEIIQDYIDNLVIKKSSRKDNCVITLTIVQLMNLNVHC